MSTGGGVDCPSTEQLFRDSQQTIQQLVDCYHVPLSSAIVQRVQVEYSQTFLIRQIAETWYIGSIEQRLYPYGSQQMTLLRMLAAIIILYTVETQ